MLTDVRQFNNKVIDINMSGTFMVTSATDLANGPANTNNKSEIKLPNKRLIVKALLIYLFVKSFC
jgi:hypothetical protein